MFLVKWMRPLLIQGILKLLGNKKCEFHDVFLKEGKFHCFPGSPEEREKAIERFFEALSAAAGGKGETESEIDDSLPEQVKKLTLHQ